MVMIFLVIWLVLVLLKVFVSKEIVFSIIMVVMFR